MVDMLVGESLVVSVWLVGVLGLTIAIVCFLAGTVSWSDVKRFFKRRSK